MNAKGAGGFGGVGGVGGRGGRGELVTPPFCPPRMEDKVELSRCAAAKPEGRRGGEGAGPRVRAPSLICGHMIPRTSVHSSLCGVFADV